MRTKKVEVVKDRWTDGLALEISHNGWQTTSISNLDVEDLKRISIGHTTLNNYLRRLNIVRHR